MRSVNYRDDVLFPVAHLLGIDPTQDLNKDHARAWNSFANSRVSQGVDYWPWRQLEVTEERAFRTIWKATRPVALFDEIFYLPTFLYYRAIATPPDGTLPTDTLYYEEVTLTDFYIALDQPGRRPIGEVLGVWAGNPRTNGCTPLPLAFRPSEKGIDVGQPHGLTVFVRYKFLPSKFSVEEYNAATQYARRAVVYWTDGDCYEALQPVTGHSPAELAYWRKVLMPALLADFVKYSVAADAAEDLQAVARFKIDAQDAIETEAGRLAEQGQKVCYNGSGRRSCGYYSFGVWGASPPFAPDATTTTLTDADDPFAEEGDTMFDDGLTPIVNGNSYVDVELAPTWSGSAAYSFLELQVKNVIDSPPLELWPTTLVSQTGTGFRILLNAAPDNDNYFLKWRIAL